MEVNRSGVQVSGWEDQSRMNFVIQEEEVEESNGEEAETSQKLTNEELLEEYLSANKEQSETDGEVVSEFQVVSKADEH